MSLPLDRKLTTSEVAYFLHVHRSTVAEMVRDGRLRGFPLDPKRKASELRIDPRSVLDLTGECSDNEGTAQLSVNQ